jgi:hypothetical protein
VCDVHGYCTASTQAYRRVSYEGKKHCRRDSVLPSSHRTQDLCMERTVQDAIGGGRGGARGIHHRDHHAQGTQDTSMMIEWIEKEKIQ